MILTCPREALPGDAAAFLICTHELIVNAVSKAGERIFGKESKLIGSHLLDHVTSPMGEDQIVRYAGVAAQRPGRARRHAAASHVGGQGAPDRHAHRSHRHLRAAARGARNGGAERVRTPVNQLEAVQEPLHRLRNMRPECRNLHADATARAENLCKDVWGLQGVAAACEVMAHGCCDSHGMEGL